MNKNNEKGALMQCIVQATLKKLDLYKNSLPRYLVRCFLACLLLSIGVSIACFSGVWANNIVSGLGRFVYAFMFSSGLLTIIYLNAELGTSNMMYLTAAPKLNTIKQSTALKMLGLCVLFNFFGAVFTTFFISLSEAYSNSQDVLTFLKTAVSLKTNKPPHQQFVEGILANIIVNIAVFCNLKMKDDAGRIMATIFIIFIFAFLGFEHVLANFSLFSLAFWTNGGLIEGVSLMMIISNFIFAGLGNYVGGALVGLTYTWLNQKTELYLD